MTNPTWTEVAAKPNPVSIAIEATVSEIATLSITCSIRVGRLIRVQVYHAPDVEPPRNDCFGAGFRKHFRKQDVRIAFLPPKPITVDLSPARIVADLLGLPKSEYLSRIKGDACRPRRKPADRRKGHPKPDPSITVRLIGHGFEDKLLRLGTAFVGELLTPAVSIPAVGIGGGAVARFRDPADSFAQPVIEYVVADSSAIRIRCALLDLNRACGTRSFDEQARSLLGLAPNTPPSDLAPATIRAALADLERCSSVHRYAAQNAVAALLVAEKLEGVHREIAKDLGLPPERVPMHGTPGIRGSTLMLHHVSETAARGSKVLGSKNGGGDVGLGRLKNLAMGGGAEALSDGRVTRYGLQTGDTHGGLLHSRTPVEFFHAAPGQFRDIDMAHCYPKIIERMSLNIGRPIVCEPGSRVMTLREALPYLEKHSAGPDSWFVKVTGPIVGFRNTLIPSGLDALTNDSYRSRNGGRALRAANTKRIKDKRGGEAPDGKAARKGTALFTDEIQAGIVTHATVMLIAALPQKIAEQYLDLRVESIDEKFISLRYDIGKFAEFLIERRQSVGKDSAQGLMLKVLANCLYGSIASCQLPLGNVVAANVITATARALAFAMTQSLNAHAVITDGVLFRRDQIPAIPFAKCLAYQPTYPLLRAGEGGAISFLVAESVPEDDAGFTKWYQIHVARFFGVQGKPEYAQLFGLHAIEQKEVPNYGAAFDGLIIDGSSNYAKLHHTPEDKWRVLDFKARSIPKSEKKGVARRLLRIYAYDHFDTLLELIRGSRTLDPTTASRMVERLLSDGTVEFAHWPCGLTMPTRMAYKLIKPSQFLFRSASQRKSMLKAWDRVTLNTACGLELLALRRTYENSLTAVAKTIFELIEASELDMASLNLDRLWRPGKPGTLRKAAAEKFRDEDRKKFGCGLIVQQHSDQRERTGLQVDLESLRKILLVK